MIVFIIIILLQIISLISSINLKRFADSRPINSRNYFWLTTSTKKTPDNYCDDKEDDGLYENENCKKYWHCLYVGTIFQSAVERKCPIGTMFHPLIGQCEISTVVSLINTEK
jgi:hypothetical protein